MEGEDILTAVEADTVTEVEAAGVAVTVEAGAAAGGEDNTRNPSI